MTADRITFVIPSLTSGGAERVMSTMANFWAEQGRHVTIVTLSSQDDVPFYPLDPAVYRVGLGVDRPARTPLHAVANNLGRLRRLRRAIRTTDPNVVISFLDHTNVLTLLATRVTRLPVIVCEHTDPGLAERHAVWDRLRSLLYPRAAQVVVLSESGKQFFGPTIQKRTRIVPNPIQVAPPNGYVAPNGRSSVVSMGRFGPEKGFDLLLDAFALVADRFPSWDLVIWGDGNLRADLTAQTDRLNLTDRVRLPGRTTTPHAELRTGQIYALTSRREGFPMALAEAMGCGLPAVAFDLPSGPRVIIRDRVDGLLVPNGDVTAFATALASLMESPERRAEMASKAPDVLERFGVDKVMAIWDGMIAEVTGQA